MCSYRKTQICYSVCLSAERKSYLVNILKNIIASIKLITATCIYCLKNHFNFINSSLFLFRLTRVTQGPISSFAYVTNDFWHSKVFQRCDNMYILTPLRKQKPSLFKDINCKSVFFLLKSWWCFSPRRRGSGVLVGSLHWYRAPLSCYCCHGLRKLAEQYDHFCISTGPSAPTGFISLF